MRIIFFVSFLYGIAVWVKIEYAEMVEWSIAAVLKTVETRVSGGSNPSLCAKNMGMTVVVPIFFCLWKLRGIRGWEPFCESKTLCLTNFEIWHTRWQRTTLITSERGAPLKARIPLSAPTKKHLSRCFFVEINATLFLPFKHPHKALNFLIIYVII